jgi:hypothetical protein
VTQFYDAALRPSGLRQALGKRNWDELIKTALRTADVIAGYRDNS